MRVVTPENDLGDYLVMAMDFEDEMGVTENHAIEYAIGDKGQEDAMEVDSEGPALEPSIDADSDSDDDEDNPYKPIVKTEQLNEVFRQHMNVENLAVSDIFRDIAQLYGGKNKKIKKSITKRP